MEQRTLFIADAQNSQKKLQPQVPEHTLHLTASTSTLSYFILRIFCELGKKIANCELGTYKPKPNCWLRDFFDEKLKFLALPWCYPNKITVVFNNIISRIS